MILRILTFVLAMSFFMGGEVSFGGSLETLLPLKGLPEGWRLMEGPRTYNKKTLFEHINGQAELFIQYGFQSSVFVIYQHRKKNQTQIEMDLYDMGNVLNAFGIFSRFRSEDRPGGIGLDSYFDENSGFFYKGRYFVMLYATESNPELLKEWALRVSNRISDHSPPPREISFFPQRGLKPGSLQYFPKGLLGREFLKQGFQGLYSGEKGIEGKEFHLFLSVFKDSKEAGETLNSFKTDMAKRGKILASPHARFGKAEVSGIDPYQGRILILQKGFYLLGAVGFEREEDLEKVFSDFLKKVK